MTKKTASSKQPVNHWKMDNNVSNEVNFRTSLGDMYHGLQISRFPKEVKLAEFGCAPFRERSAPYGLTPVISYSTTHVMIPMNGIVKADARLSLDYADESSCGPEFLYEAYFSKGALVSVDGDTRTIKPYLDEMLENMREPAEKLRALFSSLIGARLEIERPFQKIQGLIRHSDLPDHYKEAVKGIL